METGSLASLDPYAASSQLRAGDLLHIDVLRMRGASAWLSGSRCQLPLTLTLSPF